MAGFQLLVIVGALLALLPFSLGQYQPYPCRAESHEDNYFDLTNAQVCNWDTYDKWTLYVGKGCLPMGTVPFGGCTGWFTCQLKAICHHMYWWYQQPPPSKMASYWLPETKVFPPNSVLMIEWPLTSPCQKGQPEIPPNLPQKFFQVQQIDNDGNRIGPMWCVWGAEYNDWESSVPNPDPPPYGYTSDAVSRSTSSDSTMNDLVASMNSTELSAFMLQQLMDRRASMPDEATMAYAALDSDDPRINKTFVMKQIIARNLTRPSPP